MFCPKCGKSNAETAEFCGGCGCRLKNKGNEEESTKSEIVPVGEKKEKKKGKKRWFVLFILVVILAGAAGGIYHLYEQSQDTYLVKEEYLEYLHNGKYEQAYAMLELEESEWLTVEHYQTVMANQSVDMDDIKVKQQEEKKWLIFPQWKIVPERQVAKAVQLIVPKDSKVILNGKELEESYKEQNKTVMEDTYILPELFVGTYPIHIDSPYYESMDAEVVVTYQSTSTEIDLSGVVLKEEFLMELQELGKETIKNLYEAAINESGTEGQNENYESLQDLSYAYNSLTSSIHSEWKSRELREITFSDFEITAKVPEEKSGKICIPIHLQYAYEYQYDVKDDGSSGKNNGTTYTDMRFVLVDGKWKVWAIDIESVF